MMGVSSANAPALDLPARFMALGITALIVSALSAPWSLPLLQEHFSTFKLLAFVHLNTLGFIGAMLIGASYQLVPVAIQTPLASVRLGRWSFWCYGIGLIIFLIGLDRTWLAGLAIGGTLLGIGFFLYTGIILATWRRTPDRDVVSWHIALGVINGWMGMTMGVTLAFNKSNGMLGSGVLDHLAAHITLMLGGWVTLTLFGVAYRLIGMFTLAEQHFNPRLAWFELALIEGGVWLLVTKFTAHLPALFGQIAGVMLLGGVGCFIAQIVNMYRHRLRRAIDVHMPFALLAGLFAITATVLMAYAFLNGSGPNEPIWVAAIFLMLFGMAETAIQGLFYKIATFLVWLKRYAPVAGTQPVPKLEEMYNLRLALIGGGFWAIAIAGTAISLLIKLNTLPVFGIAMLLGAGCFVLNVVSIARHWKSRVTGMQPGVAGAPQRPPLRTVTRRE